ncbi:VOC family protein [Arenibacterium sp. CAU 1754]
MQLDHIAVAATTLAEAAAKVEEALGLPMQPGGQHDMFGTHNTLMGLADGLYLEAISIDPQAVPPTRPRWFDLDRFTGPARLSNWICATDDTAAALADLPEGAGHPVSITRGNLRWKMAVPDNGILPYDNMFPAVIEWQGAVHPSAALTNPGCRLLRLTVRHPKADALERDLSPQFSDARVVFETGDAGLCAEFETAHGRRILE